MSNPQDPPPRVHNVPIDVDWSDEPKAVYSNGAQILNSQREFALVFTEFMAFPGRGGTAVNQAPKAKIAANVRLTPEIFFQLTMACASNWNKYVQKYGDSSAPAPTFELLNGGQLQLEEVEPKKA